jgi:hypothetical protein
MNEEEVLLKRFINRMFEVSDNDFNYEQLTQYEDALDMKELGGVDIEGVLEWYEIFTWTTAQRSVYKDWLFEQFKIEFQFDDEFANSQVDSFLDKYGLTIDDNTKTKKN